LNWYPVKHFPLDADLSELTTYLRQRGLVHRITEDNGQQLLTVVDEQVIPALLQFLQTYEQGQVQFQAPPAIPSQQNQSVEQLIADMKTTPVVVVLIALSVMGALLTQTDWGDEWLHLFTFQDVDARRFVPLIDSLRAGEVWRLLTPAFLHFGLFHVLFNSLWMWDFGRRVERLLGAQHFVLFFCFTAVASNLSQYGWSGSSMFGGMSGVVYALVGFIAVRQRIVPHSLIAVPSALIGFMLFWLVLCMTGVVDYFIKGGIANAAHVGGLIAGAFYAWVTSNHYKQP